MTKPRDILSKTAHRPFPLPKGQWIMYQDWRDVLFLHYKADKNLLQKHIAKHTKLDLFEDEAWLSIVAFGVKNAHPRPLPPLPVIANFLEVNLRTYVTNGRIPGVCFLDIKADNLVQVLFNRLLAGLPYKQAAILATKGAMQDYFLTTKNKDCYLDISFSKNDVLPNKTPLDVWLTERYCSYQQTALGTLRYPIHHAEWPLHEVHVDGPAIHWGYRSIYLTADEIASVHFSPGVSVLFWPPEKV